LVDLNTPRFIEVNDHCTESDRIVPMVPFFHYIILFHPISLVQFSRVMIV
jgi:hypothetical protein